MPSTGAVESGPAPVEGSVPPAADRVAESPVQEVEGQVDMYRAAALSASRPGIADDLLRLARLYEAGVLSEAEFLAAKAQVFAE